MACKRCKGQHRGWERCPKLQATAGAVVHAEAAPSAGSSQPTPLVVHESRHGAYADPEKRRKYRREWMRARRAAEKAARQP